MTARLAERASMTAAEVIPALSMRNLRTTFRAGQRKLMAVQGVDLDVFPGECLAVVGESGSGKSITFKSVMGLVKPPGAFEADRLDFFGRDLLSMSDAMRNSLRGGEIAMTMQDALSALNPALTIKTQVSETLLRHGKADNRRDAAAQAVSLLHRVGIPLPRDRLNDYPHQLSGGMRQRVMMAVALACRPKLLIADEPTTALDVTIQAQVLDLIARLRAELAMSVVLITHDLGVVAGYADRVAVMYAGQLVETGPARDVIADPLHPYTQGLIASIPRLDRLGARLKPIPGQVPALTTAAQGCRFAPRCPHVRADCLSEPIPMSHAKPGREARCILVTEPC